ncbi:MAG: rhamnan synthesis F family protein [Bacteroidia bacterium]|nr:rhamnan synthesis F family protein [Bacteroidia bacterium]NNJ56365.1 hypothetical protein [Bacteroidia bacterium]
MIKGRFQSKKGESFWNKTILFQKIYSDLSNRVCVFAHYHHSDITPDVLFYLNALKEANWSIIFISTGENISSTKFESLSSLCAIVIQRQNIGYDFGSYATGYYELDPNKTTELLFCNDSVYGPFNSLLDVEAKMKQFDFWGITDSSEKGYHLQSYFLHFNRRTIQNAKFHTFIGLISPEKSKRKLIKKYELGLSKHLQKANLSCGSFISAPVILSKYSQNPEAHSNVSIHFPEELIDEGMPFIKKQVLTENPGNKNLERLKKLLGEHKLN